ncbi:DNA polymerase kappa [Discoglossus pictus]
MDSKEEKEIAPGNEAFQFRMGLNDNKAGMEGLDKEKINKIIMDATKGSRFYDNELKKDQQVNQRIEKMMQQKAQLTSQQLKKAQIQVDKLVLQLEQRRDLSRVIVHVDMDAFYAAVEMRDSPDLKDKPMAVGSTSMLSTSNYLARRYGVRAAMPGFIAKRLCPNLIIVPPNFDKYRAVSKEVREVLAAYDSNFLPLSLDEAYLDITDHLEERVSWPEDKRRYFIRKGTAYPPAQCEDDQCTSPVLFEDSPPLFVGQNVILEQDTNEENANLLQGQEVVFGISAEEAVKEMRFRIEQKTKLTASAGIAPNMLLAKVCSDKNKPNGQYRIPHDRQAVLDFVKDLPIRKVPGIGKVTEKMLKALGITTCTDLYQQRALLSLLFSEISWHNFLNISLANGSTHVEKDGERKSISTERTFSEISSAEELYGVCLELCKDLAQDIKKEGLKGKTVTLKLKNVQFEVKTRATTVISAVSTEEEIFSVAKEILSAEMDLAAPEPLRLRLMGVRVSGFLNEEEKKHQQKSIINFLRAGTSTSGGSLAHHEKPIQDMQAPEKAAQATQAPVPHRESFFNKKRAARQLETQELSRENCVFENKIEPMKASSSSEEGKKIAELEQISQAPSLTCPVCFQEQSGWDLEGFNKHIDECLSRTPLSNVFETVEKPEEEPVLRSNNVIQIENIDNVVCKNNLKNKPAHRRLFNKLGNCVLDDDEVTVDKSQDMDREIQISPNHCILSEAEQSNTHDNEMHSENIVGGNPKELIQKNDNIDDAQPCSSLALEEPTFICPVCNLKQNTTDLLVFNRHVDICLNEGIIQELKQGNSIPRKSDPVPNSKNIGSPGKRNLSLKSTSRAKRPGVVCQNPVSKKPKPNRSTNTIDKFFK